MPLDDIVTVRVPALTEKIGISLDDRVILWIQSEDLTKQVTVAQLRAFIIENFSGTEPPVYVNGQYVVVVGEAEAGGQTFPIPSLAGKTFNLWRNGGGIIPTDQFAILTAGGFQLTTPGDILVEGEIFGLDIREYQNTTGAVGSMALSGVKPVPVSTTLVASDVNKLIQIRSATTPLTLTLPKLEDIQENTIWPVETMIGNSFKCKIQTQNSQNIYFRNTSRTFMYIGPGESIEFFAGPDGWYVRNPVGNWGQVGDITPSYLGGLNKIICDGSLYDRASEPRLWEFAQTLGGILVSDSIWQTASVSMSNPTRIIPYPFRGRFSTGNGSTTFRVPDLRNQALRSVKRAGGFSPLASSTDTERYENLVGTYQDDMVKVHAHKMFIDNINSYTGEALSASNSPARREGSGGGQGNANYEYNITGRSGTPTLGNSENGAAGSAGTETRMANNGVNWYINS